MMRVQIEADVLDALIRVYGVVRHSLAVYDRRRDPNELDHLVYQVTKLYRLARLITASTDDALEGIGKSLSIFEGLQQAQNLMVMATEANSERRAVVRDMKHKKLWMAIWDGRFRCFKGTAGIFACYGIQWS